MKLKMNVIPLLEDSTFSGAITLISTLRLLNATMSVLPLLRISARDGTETLTVSRRGSSFISVHMYTYLHIPRVGVDFIASRSYDHVHLQLVTNLPLMSGDILKGDTICKFKVHQ